METKNNKTDKDALVKLEMISESVVSNCGCSTTSCCDDSRTTINQIQQHMRVTIDGKMIDVTPFDKNIIDVAGRAKIRIPAPCYRTQRKYGCCSACVVEIDGEQKFACSTVPANGMNIVVNRADLKAIRKQRLLEYKEGVKSGNPIECSLPGTGDCCK